MWMELTDISSLNFWRRNRRQKWKDVQMTEPTESSYFLQKDLWTILWKTVQSSCPRLCNNVFAIYWTPQNRLDCKNRHLKNIKPSQFIGKDLPNWLEPRRIGAIAAIPLTCVCLCVCAHGYLHVCVWGRVPVGPRTCPITAILSRELSFAAIQFIYFIYNIMLQWALATLRHNFQSGALPARLRGCPARCVEVMNTTGE